MGITKRGSIELSRAIEKFEEHVIDEVKKVIVKTANIIQTQAVALAPVDTSALKDSIQIEYYKGGLGAKIIVGAQHGIWVEYGTGIYAVNGDGRKTLYKYRHPQTGQMMFSEKVGWSYWSDDLQQWVFTQGNKAQPFFFPAVEMGAEYFERAMNRLG